MRAIHSRRAFIRGWSSRPPVWIATRTDSGVGPGQGSAAIEAYTRCLRAKPDYLPARMVNEFVYCPRLFFLEWVEGVFRSSVTKTLVNSFEM